jgi:polysaccharide pyruvyl transferase WcaK-like protein
MKRNVRIGISYGGLYYPNLGCGALTYSTLQILGEIGRKLNINFDYVLRTNYDVNNIYIPNVLEGYSITFLDKNTILRTLLKNMRRRNLFDPLQFNELKKCDFFIDVVGGDSFSDIYGLERIKKLYNDFKLLGFLGKKVILLPQTIGPYKSKVANDMANKIMHQASHIYARDMISYDEACRFVPVDKVEMAVDMALYMNYEPRLPNGKKKVIGINPSGLLWHGGYTRNNQFGLKEDYQMLLRKCIEFILQKGIYEIELIAHVLTGNYAINIEDDFHACRELQREYPACRLAPFFYTPIEAKSYISGLDGLLGSRMHCCIAAYSSGVPVFPLAYSRKFRGMFKETLDYSYGAELQDDDASIVMVKLSDFLDNLDATYETMISRIAILQEYKDKFIESLSRQISLCLQIR